MKAAELCPAHCIHPGSPRSDDATATPELIARAAAAARITSYNVCYTKLLRMWVVGLLCSLYHRDLKFAKDEVRQIFERKRKGDEVIETNHRLLSAGYDWATRNLGGRVEVPSHPAAEAQVVMSGNAALALGVV